MPSIFELAGLVRPVIIFLANDFELVRVDATISEEYQHRYKATSHPLENGGVASDHIIRRGDTIRLTGIMSNNPIDIREVALANSVGALGNLVGGIGGAVATVAASKIKGKYLRDKRLGVAAYEAIKLAQAEKNLFTLSTGLAVAENLVLEQFTANRTAQNSSGLSFRALFSQVEILSGVELGEIPAGVSENKGAEEILDSGTVPIEDADPQVTSKSASWLLGIGKEYTPGAINVLQGLAQ